MITVALLLLAAAQAQPRIKPNYCFGMLMASPNRPDIPKDEAMKIQEGHMAHLNALAEKNWLVAAGPMMTPGNLRGLVISKCKSLDEARQFAGQDPAVKAGRLFLEAYLWQAPEGLGDRYRAEQYKNPQAKVTMVKYPIAFLIKTVQWNGWPSMALLKEHGASVSAHLNSGKMKTAGPFEDGGSKIGVFIFAPMPLEEARQIAENDPTVKAGLARVEMMEWLAADGTFLN
ncbi:MAG: hypothetical protein JNK48_03475 [Bryobacterales bacterium]|nr:hypothetical protein [Bryobacterales bacterium]